MTTTSNAEAYRRAIDGLGKWRAVRYTLFPPRDLYVPVFEVAPVAEHGRFFVATACVHRCAGPYEIGVRCARRIENPVSCLGKVQIVVTFSDRSGKLVARIEREVTQATQAWWDGPQRSGFGLACYAVPTEVPVRESLHCRVDVYDFDGALGHYRPVVIYSRCAFRP